MEVTDPSSALPRIAIPNIALPKGGGALSGIGNEFQPNSFSGTGNYTIPIPVTTARGFEPQLALNYNSGGGNSAFGLGFALSLTKFSLTTNKGIPQYTRADHYLLTGEGELVKKATTGNNIQKINGEDWIVVPYLPRVESSYSKIEQWTNKENGVSFWKVISKNNVTTTFGKTGNSRIVNPSVNTQIFEWLPDQSTDAKGNKIIYTYKAENDYNIPHEIYEVNRSYEANRYLQSINYGNYIDDGGDEQYAFEVVFDYGEYDLSNLGQKDANPYIPTKKWAYRPDAFSTFNSGFEIRTCRLCQNILLFHHFENELGAPCLVKRTALNYDHLQDYHSLQINTMALMKRVVFTGYRKNEDGSYEEKSLPSLELKYSSFKAPTSPVFKTLEMSGNTIPGYIGNMEFLPVDLYGEGLQGFLLSSGETTVYLAPQGEGKYTLPEDRNPFPINKNIQNGDVYLVDLDGNGQLELLADKGYYSYNDAGNWDNYQAFPSYPTNASDPFIEASDVNASGKTDLLLATGNEIFIYLSEGKKGYQPGKSTQRENGFPLKTADPSGTLVTFANMFGDGLSHRVSIKSGLIECWPCLGHGRYGKKITLGNAPLFGTTQDNSRIFLADIDGSGTTDLVYVYSNQVALYINQNGNSFSPPILINLPEQYSEADQIHFMDINGNGTSCLVFSKMTPVPHHYYYDFTGEIILSDGQVKNSMKPYLLNEINNNMGSVTEIRYCSSTKFILEDKRAGRPWVTKLRFPVQVVEETTVYDQLSGAKYVNKFKYHDGYYDPVEREFRGFGFVESWDTETFMEYEQSLSNPTFPVNRLNRELYVPPVYTRTWCHTGAFVENDTIIAQYQQEYFQGDPQALNLPGSVFDPKIYAGDADTLRQAYVALKGTVMRKEVYASDDQPASVNPYTVEASNVKVTLVQPQGEQRYAVFSVHQRESISYNYERNAADPRVTQHFILEVDPLCGDVKQSCTVYLPRRNATGVYPEQQVLRATASRNDYINTPDDLDYRWRGMLFRQEQFEISTLTLAGNTYFSYDSIHEQVTTALQNIVPYLGTTDQDKLQALQLTWNQVFFWDEDQKNEMPAGQISSKGLLHHEQAAAFTTENIRYLFGDHITTTIIENEGGYIFDKETGYWQNKGLVQHYFNTPASFYMLWKTENSFTDPASLLYQRMELSYDIYNFVVVNSKQYLDETTFNEVSATNDYQAMKLRQLIDINKNVTQLLYDPLAYVVVSSLFGEEDGTPTGGMLLYKYLDQQPAYIKRVTNADGKPITFTDVINDPEYYLQGATSYFFYDLNTYKDNSQPICNINLQRTAYYYVKGGITPFSCRQLIEYSDGLGRSIEKKQLVDPGVANIIAPDGTHKQAETNTRWLVSGRTVYNNKGKVCEAYLPYFSNTPDFETQNELVDEELIVPPTITHYDPLSRPVRIDSPKGFFSKVEFTPWEEKQYDEDDTVKESDYYISFMADYPVNPTQEQINEKDALDKAATFFNTPAIQVMDNTGRVFLNIQNNLGKVLTDAFASILNGSPITSKQVWDELGLREYLSVDGWLTTKFRPYEIGFILQLAPEFDSFIGQITDLLKQNCLTAYAATDITGRIITAIDARLYYSNITKGTNYYNFKYGYEMGAEKPILTDSVDAGKPFNFNNIFGNLVWSWSPRNYNQLITYDRVQRRTQVRVKQITDGDKTISADQYPLVEEFIYGETQANPTAQNLCGQLYQLNDLAGILINHKYSMQAKVLEGTRQLNTDYKMPVDWNNPAGIPMEPDIYRGIFTYNALGQVLTEQSPDGTITSMGYNMKGLPEKISVKYVDNTLQAVVNQIEYDAKDQRTKIMYANGIRTAYTYEDTTLRLLLLKSTRQDNTVMQHISYTYDPVGNTTRVYDSSIDAVFNNNQQVVPVSDYTYDALYRLINAGGRQHTGIMANTYKNNTADGDFKQSKFSQLPSDYSSLENYIEKYTYDDSFNLIKNQHIAVSASWTRETPVEENSNRLRGLEYDASGNMRQLLINSAVSLSFNCCENLVKAGIISRPGEQDDCDYYNYDSGEMRIRKVSERMANGGTVTSIEEKIYLGNYEIKRQKTVNEKGSITITLDRQTLRIMDASECILVINYWKQDDNNKETAKAGTRQLRWQLSNQLHSVAMEVDTDAQLISYEEYYPYGETAIIAGKDKQEVAIKDYRYSGKERDDSTGLYYYGARYYVSWMGRWIKPDPAGSVDGLNLYAYVGGNPITFTDPTGLTREVAVSDRTRQHLQDAQDAINYTRLYLPFAGNVRDDIITTQAESSTRLTVSRSILTNTFGNVEGVGAGTDAINRAASAVGACGGACNEYSALTHSYLISRTTNEPLIRVWDVDVHHSFTLIGDPRALSDNEVVVVDAWPSHYQAATLADTRWSTIISPSDLTVSTETPLVSGPQAALNAQNLTAAINAIPAIGAPGGKLPLYADATNTAGRDDVRVGRGAISYAQFYNDTLTDPFVFNNDYSTHASEIYDYYHDTSVVTGSSFFGSVKWTDVTRTYHTGRTSNFQSWRLF